MYGEPGALVATLDGPTRVAVRQALEEPGITVESGKIERELPRFVTDPQTLVRTGSLFPGSRPAARHTAHNVPGKLAPTPPGMRTPPCATATWRSSSSPSWTGPETAEAAPPGARRR